MEFALAVELPLSIAIVSFLVFSSIIRDFQEFYLPVLGSLIPVSFLLQSIGGNIPDHRYTQQPRPDELPHSWRTVTILKLCSRLLLPRS